MRRGRGSAAASGGGVGRRWRRPCCSGSCSCLPVAPVGDDDPTARKAPVTALVSSPLAPYAAPEAREARLDALTAAAGGSVETIGQSVLGRPLRAARLPCLGAAAGAPRLLSVANIHGPEYVSSEVALGLLERASHLPALRQLRERAELWVLPCLNPDAYARVWERGGQGGIAELRPNENGVDLNRNFPLPAGRTRGRWPGAGSTVKGEATYVGEAPLSEPESAALAALCRTQRFTAVVSGHSFMGRVIPAHVEDRASHRRYRHLCRALAAAQPRWRYGRLASRHFDTFTGELEDFLHHHLGTWAACLETFPLGQTFRQHLRAPSLFWRFNPRDPRPFVDNDVPGIAAFFAAALDLGTASW